MGECHGKYQSRGDTIGTTTIVTINVAGSTLTTMMKTKAFFALLVVVALPSVAGKTWHFLYLILHPYTCQYFYKEQPTLQKIQIRAVSPSARISLDSETGHFYNTCSLHYAVWSINNLFQKMNTILLKVKIQSDLHGTRTTDVLKLVYWIFGMVGGITKYQRILWYYW